MTIEPEIFHYNFSISYIGEGLRGEEEKRGGRRKKRKENGKEGERRGRMLGREVSQEREEEMRNG